jgi:hypothetical protein
MNPCAFMKRLSPVVKSGRGGEAEELTNEVEEEYQLAMKFYSVRILQHSSF